MKRLAVLPHPGQLSNARPDLSDECGTARGRPILGAALAVCLASVAVMVWLDRRTERETRRLIGRR
ncbi:MAG TPA: hypothetical protein VMS99_11715 [Acidimicrobiia bacterium]|nr:hypothetical protein [Acidimicrobiia bacterium]